MRTTRKDRSRPILERSETDAEGWDCCASLDKAEAEMLLDWLEVHGFAQREVVYVEEEGFTVRWRRDK
jgi:hypothetical protein